MAKGWYDNSAEANAYLSGANRATASAQQAAIAGADATRGVFNTLGNTVIKGVELAEQREQRNKAEAKDKLNSEYLKTVIAGGDVSDKKFAGVDAGVLAKGVTLQNSINTNTRAENKAEQDKLLGDALVQANQDKTITGTEKRVTRQGNEAEVELAKNLRNRVIDKNTKRLQQQEEGSTKYAELFDKYSNQKVGAAPRVPGTQYTKNTDGSYIEADSVFGRWLGKKQPSEQMYTPEQAHTLALRESGLGGVRGTLEVPTVPKLVETVTKQVPVTRNMTQTEWLKKSVDSIMNRTDLTGSTKLAAKKALEKEVKGPTFDQLFKVKKMQKETQDDHRVGTNLAKTLNIQIPKGLTGTALLDYVKGTKQYANRGDAFKTPKKYGAGPKTLQAYDSGLGTIDEKDQAKIAKAAKDVKMSDADLASIITTFNTQDWTPRFSGEVTKDVVKYIKDNAK